jgi:hypothetical protein
MKVIATLFLAGLFPVLASAAPKELTCKLGQTSNPTQLTIDEGERTALWRPPYGASPHKADAEFSSDVIKWNYKDEDSQGHTYTSYFELNRLNGALRQHDYYDDPHQRDTYLNYTCSASQPIV